MRIVIVLFVLFLLLPLGVTAAITQQQLTTLASECGIQTSPGQQTCVASKAASITDIDTGRAALRACGISLSDRQSGCAAAKFDVLTRPTTPPSSQTPGSGGSSQSSQAGKSGLTEFIPIVPIPNITNRGEITFADYVNEVFFLSISLSGVLAVLMLIYGGFQYMTSDVISAKGKGLDKIRNAITGLVLLLSSYLILYIINPCIVKITVFQGASECSPRETPPSNPNNLLPTTRNDASAVTGAQVFRAGSDRMGPPGSFANCPTPVQPACWNQTARQYIGRTGDSCTDETFTARVDICVASVGSPP